MKNPGIVVCLLLSAIVLAIPTVGAVNTDGRPFQNVHALTVLSAVNWNVVGTGVVDMADAIDEWVPDGSSSYAYTRNSIDVATLKLHDLQPADPYTTSDQTDNQSYTLSMMSSGSGGVEFMFVYLYVCSLGIPGGNIIAQQVALSRTVWTPVIIKVFADLTGYWDDLCIGFVGRFIVAPEEARVTWAEMRAPPAKQHGPSAFPLILGLSAILVAGVVLPIYVPPKERKRGL